MKIAIIGAGIGGLTTAIALKQKGFEVEVFEASTAFKKAGSGINLAINAMQVFKRLGIYKEIASSGNYTNALHITDDNLNKITSVNLQNAETTYKAKTYAIHRATLHTILVTQLADVPIHLNKKLQSVSQDNNKVTIDFEDGTSKISNILIGADGIHSMVRKSLFSNTKLRAAKQVCWRGIVKIGLPQAYKTELNELWGKGKRFGFVHINEHEVYWYALANYKSNYQKEYSDTNLEELFSDFNPLVKKIIAATSKNAIIFNEMIDLQPITTWHKNNVCLIGDAAHATTPNLGQGACQAIESAYVIAECLAVEKNIHNAFKKLEKIRKNTATQIVNKSWSIGKLAHLKNGFAIFLRNSILKLMPKKLSEKQSTAVYKLNY